MIQSAASPNPAAVAIKSSSLSEGRESDLRSGDKKGETSPKSAAAREAMKAMKKTT